ncbi:MAG: D-glycerate dehydrogenase [Candidatus Saccharicenans sp.]|jgi:glyoxylate reductase|nr:D-glycerate dehydrogenase [Candidatus Saccharicenans sp.]MDH7492942.1 D-glycerate dehydrogenase [Candidatus Saccharicenans sp.]
MKAKVLLTHPLLPEAMDYLASQVELELATREMILPRSELLARVGDKQGLLCFLTDTIDREVMDRAPELKVISNCAVGVNNIDLKEAWSRGLLVTNTPEVLTEATADLTLSLILATTRRLVEADRFCREGRFRGWQVDLFLGQELSGRTLGIIGFGRIGRAVARRALAFNLKIIYHDPHRLEPALEKELQVEYRELDELLREADIVSIHARLTPQSYQLISRDRLQLMKKTAVLINVARGPIVEEKALAEALTSGRLWAAGLDVYENEPDISPELLRLDNVILLPHIGSATYETRKQMCFLAVKNLLQGLRGERPDNLVEPS